jgi:hypothetical protein
LKEITLSIGPGGAGKIHLFLVVPNERKGPAPDQTRPEGDALAQQGGAALTDILGRALDGRVGQVDAAHLLEQFGPLLKAGADAACQADQGTVGLEVKRGGAVAAGAEVAVAPSIFLFLAMGRSL